MDLSESIAVDSHLTFSSRVVQSPMQGVMSGCFISAVNHLGLVREWITPFISVSAASVPSARVLRRMLMPYRNGYPLVVQLSGHDPDSLAETSLRLAELGAAGVNLNFACPSPTVLSAGNGGAILKNPRLAERIIDECMKRASSHINISLKLRAGFDRVDGCVALARLAADSGIRFVIFHYRTVVEGYAPVKEGLERLERFTSAAPEIAVFGNGDVFSTADAQRMCNAVPCAGVAIGRALLDNPFIGEKIRSGANEPATRREKMLFLSSILSDDISALSKGGPRPHTGGFIECVKMCFGGRSEEFEFAKNASYEALVKYFSI